MAMYQRDYVRTLLEKVNEAAVQIWEDDYMRERTEAQNELRNREQAIAAKMMMLAEEEFDDLDDDDDDEDDSAFIALDDGIKGKESTTSSDTVLVAEYSA